MQSPDPIKKSRSIGVDAARGIALVGLMIVHVLPPTNDDFEPTVLWTVFAGHSAALFALLAGVSLAFGSGARYPVKGTALKAVRASVAVRAALITALGLTIAYADTPVSIILAYYGVMFLLAIPLLGLSARVLALLAAGMAVIGPITVQVLRDSMPEHGFNPTFTSLFTEPGVLVTQLLLTGVYPAVPYMAYICAGLAIGRLDLGSRLIQFRLMFAGLILAVSTWLVSAILLGPLGGMNRLKESSPDLSAEAIDRMLVWGPEGHLPATSLWWHAVLAPHSTTVLEKLNTVGTSMAALGAVLFVAHVAASELAPFAAIGSMTLTLYSAHLLVLATGFLANQSSGSFIIQITVAIIFASQWRRSHDHGPLEGIVATATKRTRNHLSGTT
ncbi:putative membrane protein [Arthrobacter sp. CAN_A6]|uniref:heparan-alpha-glucosaminide N-acetyltransferase domain-containing protein n=1 Tax=Arthrobacter sp. CAN_A6 TaxID=2787721 RepID=UPI0018CAEE56